MDYSKLLFALQVRTLAFDMMYLDHPSLRGEPAVTDVYPDYLKRALAEAVATANFIDDSLTQVPIP